MDDATAGYYLRDLGQLVKDKALEAKERKESSSNPYDTGFLMAFYDVISLMQSQADVFGISREQISLSDINPDTELL